MIRVAAIADTNAHAEALAAALRGLPEIEVVIAGSRAGFLSAGPVDVIVADHVDPEDLPDGPAVVLIRDDALSELPARHSVRACLTPDASPAELHAAIAAAAQEFTVLTPLQTKRWLRTSPVADETTIEPEPIVESLTPRELEVLRLLADGLGNKEVAAQLGISDHTAKFHVAQILAKLGAASRAEAVAIGMRRGLVPV